MGRKFGGVWRRAAGRGRAAQGARLVGGTRVAGRKGERSQGWRAAQPGAPQVLRRWKRLASSVAERRPASAAWWAIASRAWRTFR